MSLELIAAASGPAQLEGAAESWRVGYPSTSITGEPTRLTGLMHLPTVPAPKAGWPVVTYGHMTTGGSDNSAPSSASAAHPELRRMTQGDALCRRLLGAGCVVLRPDYEGLGSPGLHPYLIGSALATSTVDLLAAARAADDRLGSRWVSAGHSEGASAALWSARREQALPDGVELVGVAAFTPVTRIDLTIGLTLRCPAVLPGFGAIPPLIGLMLMGAATADPRVQELIDGEGLTPRARALWPHLSERSLEQCASRRSWGGLPPSQLLSRTPAGDELRELLLGVLRAQEVGDLKLRSVPVRLDAAILDEVAPLALTESLARRWRKAGVDLTVARWLTSHSAVMKDGNAAPEAAAWIMSRFDN